MDSEGYFLSPVDYWYVKWDVRGYHQLDGYWSWDRCPVGTFITGFRTQVEPDQGDGGMTPDSTESRSSVKMCNRANIFCNLMQF